MSADAAEKAALLAAASENCVAEKELEFSTEPPRVFTDVNFDPDLEVPAPTEEDPERKVKVPYITFGPPTGSKKNEQIWATCYARVADPDNPEKNAVDEDGNPISTNYSIFHEPLDMNDFNALTAQLDYCPYLQKLPDNLFHKGAFTELKIGIPPRNTALVAKMQSFQDEGDKYMEQHMISSRKTKVLVKKVTKAATDTTPEQAVTKEYFDNMIKKVYYAAGEGKDGKPFPPSFYTWVNKTINTLAIPDAQVIKDGQWVNPADIGSEELVEDAEEEGLTVGEELRRELVRRGWIPDGMYEADPIRSLVNEKQFHQIDLKDVKVGDRLVLNLSDSGICCTSKVLRRGFVVINGLVFPKNIYPSSSARVVERPSALNFVFKSAPKRPNTSTTTSTSSGSSGPAVSASAPSVDDGPASKNARFAGEGDDDDY